MKSQITNSVLLIKPVDFQYNPETSNDNNFMNQINFQKSDILQEFQNCIKKLQEKNINVIVFDKDNENCLQDIQFPEAIFPNNWLSNNDQGDIFIYKMLAKSRNIEIQQYPYIEKLLKQQFKINKVNYLESQNNEEALEGTGSIIFDHINRIAYACLSQRTNKNLFLEFCKQNLFIPITFKSKTSKNTDFYHTNILMSIGDEFIVICEESIYEGKQNLLEQIQQQKRQKITISLNQAENMCGNIIQLKNDQNQKFIIMSTTAYQNYKQEQIEQLQKFGQILQFEIPLIEKIGGGSARCMICEIFLEKK